MSKAISIDKAPSPALEAAPETAQPLAVRVEAHGVGVRYGHFEALRGVNLRLPSAEIAALIGPSGCGKSTFLRALNRMNDLIDGARVTGRVTLDGIDIYGPGVDPAELRRRIGMVFQKPNPFPRSVFDNVAFGPRLHGRLRRDELAQRVEVCLRKAALWEEVKDKLNQPALALSGGQQQRLCIARALATDPEVLLLDEPCSALDPISTERIEALLRELKPALTIVIVTHNLSQAARVSDRTAFFLRGDLIEYAPTPALFSAPERAETADYIAGRFG